MTSGTRASADRFAIAFGVGARLRDARRAAGLTQAEAAERLEASRLLPASSRSYGAPRRVLQSYVSKCEAGGRRVRVADVEAFAAVYGCPVDVLATGALAAAGGGADHPPILEAGCKPRRRAGAARLLRGAARQRAWAPRLRRGPVFPAARSSRGQWLRADPRLRSGAVGAPVGYPRWRVRQVAMWAPGMPPLVPWRLPDLAVPLDPGYQRVLAELRADLSALIAADAGPTIEGLPVAYRDVLETYDADGRTPLYEAVEGGRVRAVRALVALGADVGRRLGTWWASDRRPLTPWAAAIYCPFPPAVLRVLAASDTCYGLDLEPARVRAAVDAWLRAPTPVDWDRWSAALRDAMANAVAHADALWPLIETRMRNRVAYGYEVRPGSRQLRRADSEALWLFSDPTAGRRPTW